MKPYDVVALMRVLPLTQAHFPPSLDVTMHGVTHSLLLEVSHALPAEAVRNFLRDVFAAVVRASNGQQVAGTPSAARHRTPRLFVRRTSHTSSQSISPLLSERLVTAAALAGGPADKRTSDTRPSERLSGRFDARFKPGREGGEVCSVIALGGRSSTNTSQLSGMSTESCASTVAGPGQAGALCCGDGIVYIPIGSRSNGTTPTAPRHAQGAVQGARNFGRVIAERAVGAVARVAARQPPSHGSPAVAPSVQPPGRIAASSPGKTRVAAVANTGTGAPSGGWAALGAPQPQPQLQHASGSRELESQFPSVPQALDALCQLEALCRKVNGALHARSARTRKACLAAGTGATALVACLYAVATAYALSRDAGDNAEANGDPLRPAWPTPLSAARLGITATLYANYCACMLLVALMRPRATGRAPPSPRAPRLESRSLARVSAICLSLVCALCLMPSALTAALLGEERAPAAAELAAAVPGGARAAVAYAAAVSAAAPMAVCYALARLLLCAASDKAGVSGGGGGGRARAGGRVALGRERKGRGLVRTMAFAVGAWLGLWALADFCFGASLLAAEAAHQGGGSGAAAAAGAATTVQACIFGLSLLANSVTAVLLCSARARRVATAVANALVFEKAGTEPHQADALATLVGHGIGGWRSGGGDDDGDGSSEGDADGGGKGALTERASRGGACCANSLYTARLLRVGLRELPPPLRLDEETLRALLNERAPPAPALAAADTAGMLAGRGGTPGAPAAADGGKGQRGAQRSCSSIDASCSSSHHGAWHADEGSLGGGRWGATLRGVVHPSSPASVGRFALPDYGGSRSRSRGRKSRASSDSAAGAAFDIELSRAAAARMSARSSSEEEAASCGSEGATTRLESTISSVNSGASKQPAPQAKQSAAAQQQQQPPHCRAHEHAHEPPRELEAAQPQPRRPLARLARERCADYVLVSSPTDDGVLCTAALIKWAREWAAEHGRPPVVACAALGAAGEQSLSLEARLIAMAASRRLLLLAGPAAIAHDVRISCQLWAWSAIGRKAGADDVVVLPIGEAGAVRSAELVAASIDTYNFFSARAGCAAPRADGLCAARCVRLAGLDPTNSAVRAMLPAANAAVVHARAEEATCAAAVTDAERATHAAAPLRAQPAAGPAGLPGRPGAVLPLTSVRLPALPSSPPSAIE